MLDRDFGDSAAQPRALWADFQSAGRGRRGRSWDATSGRALMFSIAIETRINADSAPPVAFSLVVGLLLAQRLGAGLDESARQRLRLKWPNDLLVDDRKLAGVLIESRRRGTLERLVIGIGLNLLADPTRPPQTADCSELGLELTDRDKQAFILALRDDMPAALMRFRLQGFGPWHAAWRRLDGFAGKEVTLRDGGEVLAQGRSKGVAETGELCLELAGGERRFIVGDVSLRGPCNATTGVRA